MLDVKARVVDRRRGCNGSRIAVERQQLPGRAQTLQDQPGMAAAAEGCVDVGSVRVGDQLFDGLCREDRTVPQGIRWSGSGHSPSEREIRGGRRQAVGERDAFVFAKSLDIPQLEVGTHAEQHHVASEAGRIA